MPSNSRIGLVHWNTWMIDMNLEGRWERTKNMFNETAVRCLGGEKENSQILVIRKYIQTNKRMGKCKTTATEDDNDNPL